MRYIVALGAMLLVMQSSASAQVRGIITSPTNVQLQAGGSAVRLTLDGSQLTSVTAVRFLLAGRLVGGISGALRSAQLLAGGASRLTLDVKADRSVPAGSYQMQLVAGTQGTILPTPIAVLPALPQPIDQSNTDLITQQPKAANTISVAPSVSSATPTSLQVRSGAPAQAVVVNGSLLNQVVGAYLRRNGTRVISGVNAAVLPSTDPARREIRVSATGTAGPWGVPLELVLEYTIGTSGVKAADAVPTPVQITASAPPNVDLEVSSCSIEQRQYELLARATVRNNGSEGAAFQAGQNIAKATASKALPQYPYYVVRAEIGGRYIAPGGTAEFSSSFSQRPEPGQAYQVKWAVDPDDVVAESNAGNNERACTVIIEPDKADLAITKLTSEPLSGPPGTVFVFKVTVQNVGSWPIAPIPPGMKPETTYLKLWCSIDGSSWNGGSIYNTLAPNETYTMTFRTSGAFAPGPKVLECTVDSDGRYRESTENNNAKSLVFTVTK